MEYDVQVFDSLGKSMICRWEEFSLIKHDIDKWLNRLSRFLRDWGDLTRKNH
jgi:hypothetical protein